MPNPVVHFDIAGKDAVALQAFYTDLFGWKIDADNPYNYGLVDTGDGEGINGGIGPGPEGTPYVSIFVQVDDLQAYLDKAESLGGKTLMPPMEIPNVVKLAVFTDPEGNRIGLVLG